MVLTKYAGIRVADWWETAFLDIGEAIVNNSPPGEPLVLSAARLKHAIEEDKKADLAADRFKPADEEELDLYMTVTPKDVRNAYLRHPELSITRTRAKSKEGLREAFRGQWDDSRLKEMAKRFKRDFRRMVDEKLWRI